MKIQDLSSCALDGLYDLLLTTFTHHRQKTSSTSGAADLTRLGSRLPGRIEDPIDFRGCHPVSQTLLVLPVGGQTFGEFVQIFLLQALVDGQGDFLDLSQADDCLMMFQLLLPEKRDTPE